MKRTRLRQVSRKRRAQMTAWPQVRDAVFARDEYTCQARRIGLSMDFPCAGPLDPHHTIKRSQRPGLALETSLVVSLCRRHHEWTDFARSSKHGRLTVTGAWPFVFSVEYASGCEAPPERSEAPQQ